MGWACGKDKDGKRTDWLTWWRRVFLEKLSLN